MTKVVTFRALRAPRYSLRLFRGPRTMQLHISLWAGDEIVPAFIRLRGWRRGRLIAEFNRGQLVLVHAPLPLAFSLAPIS